MRRIIIAWCQRRSLQHLRAHRCTHCCTNRCPNEQSYSSANSHAYRGTDFGPYGHTDCSAHHRAYGDPNALADCANTGADERTDGSTDCCTDERAHRSTDRRADCCTDHGTHGSPDAGD
jgi:hypothetical protein